MSNDPATVRQTVSDFLVRVKKGRDELPDDLALFGHGLALDPLEAAELCVMPEDTYARDPFSAGGDLPENVAVRAGVLRGCHHPMIPPPYRAAPRGRGGGAPPGRPGQWASVVTYDELVTRAETAAAALRARGVFSAWPCSTRTMRRSGPCSPRAPWREWSRASTRWPPPTRPSPSCASGSATSCWSRRATCPAPGCSARRTAAGSRGDTGRSPTARARCWCSPPAPRAADPQAPATTGPAILRVHRPHPAPRRAALAARLQPQPVRRPADPAARAARRRHARRAASSQPRDGLEAMRAHGVTHASATPTFWRFLLAELRADGEPGARRSSRSPSAARRCRRPLLERARARVPGAHISQVYAATEFGLDGLGPRRRGRPAASVLDRGDDADVAVPDRRRRAPDPLAHRRCSATTARSRSTRRRLARHGRPRRGRRRPHPLRRPRRPRSSTSAASRCTRCRSRNGRRGAGVALARVYGRPNPMTGQIVALDVVAEPGADADAVDAAIREACADAPARGPARAASRFVETARHRAATSSQRAKDDR